MPEIGEAHPSHDPLNSILHIGLGEIRTFQTLIKESGDRLLVFESFVVRRFCIVSEEWFGGGAPHESCQFEICHLSPSTQKVTAHMVAQRYGWDDNLDPLVRSTKHDCEYPPPDGASARDSLIRSRTTPHDGQNSFFSLKRWVARQLRPACLNRPTTDTKGLTLLDVIILCYVVREQSQEYIELRYDSWWFAESIGALVAILFSIPENNSSSDDTREQTLTDFFKEGKSRAYSKFKYQLNTDVLSETVRKAEKRYFSLVSDKFEGSFPCSSLFLGR